jgi:hypothetical protein
MRVVVAGLGILSLIAGIAVGASAETPPKKRHKQAQAQVRQPSATAPLPKPDPYIERNADRLPFGSSIWWDQMLRENRAGQCCN